MCCTALKETQKEIKLREHSAQVLTHRKDPIHGYYLFIIIRGQNKMEGMVLSQEPAISYM